RAVADTAPAELRRMLAYKCVWYGSRLVEADRFWPSSRTCSGCGAVKPDLPLWERTFRCDACGLVLDRDENAARNLAALAAAVAGSGQETQNARGRDVRPTLASAVPDETGSRRRASA
ncbi:MAG: transposase, partial [Armatimonadota bacterium]